jgi:hypothetical protein
MKLYPTCAIPYKGEAFLCDVGAIGREGGQSSIVERAANREMIERLPLGFRMNPEHPMHRIIKETADAC